MVYLYGGFKSENLAFSSRPQDVVAWVDVPTTFSMYCLVFSLPCVPFVLRRQASEPSRGSQVQFTRDTKQTNRTPDGTLNCSEPLCSGIRYGPCEPGILGGRCWLRRPPCQLLCPADQPPPTVLGALPSLEEGRGRAGRGQRVQAGGKGQG